MDFAKRLFRREWPALTILVIIVAVVATITAVKASSNSPKHKNMSSMVGTWHQTKNGIPNIDMWAQISNDKIQVTMKLSDTTGVFWLGTFNPNIKSQKFEVSSHGDTNAMAMDILASTETDKVFEYDHGDLSYEFSIMGAQTTVHLTKD